MLKRFLLSTTDEYVTDWMCSPLRLEKTRPSICGGCRRALGRCKSRILC